MDELREQQMEALSVASEYSVKLIDGIEKVINELKGEKLADTDDFLKHVISGINWIINVFNATKDIIAEKNDLIDKESVNSSVMLLNDSYNEKDDIKIAEALSQLLEFVKQLRDAADRIKL